MTSTSLARSLIGTVVLAVAVAGCGSDNSGSTEPTESPAPDCQAAPDPHCDHLVDELLVPRLRGLGVAMQTAPPAELCRRMHVDLVGRVPTPSELADCLVQTPAEMADTLMATDAYERVQRAFWARELGFESNQTIWWQIFDLDLLVSELVNEEIGYAEFAREVIVHPAFFVPRFDGGWGAGVFNVFLDRPPRRDEMDGMRPLSRPLSGRVVCDGRVGDNIYRECLRAEAEGEPYDEPCERVCEVLQVEGALLPCACEPNPFLEEEAGGPFFGCSGDGLGDNVDLGPLACNEYALFRLTERSAGDQDSCPDRAEPCPDIAFYELGEENPMPAEPLPRARPTDRDGLERIGEALTARRDFWEAAVDRELRRLLGWWKSGFLQPDYDLPSVRQRLADELQRTGSLRDVHRLILTSLLYTAPVAASIASEPAGPGVESERPPWAAGPVKLLAGEAWLDSASAVVGERLGLCDHRFIGADNDFADALHYLTEAGDSAESTIDPLNLLIDLGLLDQLTEEQLEQAYIAIYELTEYKGLARPLGGCARDAVPRTPSLSLVAGQSEAASLLCSVGRDAVPPGLEADDTSDEALSSAASHLWERALSRPPTDEESTALLGEMRACLDAGACDDARTAARWLCARVLDSTLFATY